MREIKFRGRRKNSTEWAYGAFLAIPRLCSYIYDVQPDGQATRYLVDEDTVGQFTGLYDTDGREIYEGDVLGNKYTSHYKFANAVVEWGVDGWLADCFSLREFLKLHTCIVVGNIYDNSELLPELPEEDDARD